MFGRFLFLEIGGNVEIKREREREFLGDLNFGVERCLIYSGYGKMKSGFVYLFLKM